MSSSTSSDCGEMCACVCLFGCAHVFAGAHGKKGGGERSRGKTVSMCECAPDVHASHTHVHRHTCTAYRRDALDVVEDGLKVALQELLM